MQNTTNIKKMNRLIAVVLFVVSVIAFSQTVSAAELPIEPEILSEAAVLMDAKTGQILYSKNMDKTMYPASITKILTGMLALKYANLDETVTMSYDAVFSIDRDSSHIALDVDEEIPMIDALYTLSIESANDAANGIAETVAGSMDAFAEMMNQEAKRIGAVNSNFVNAHGLPNENHYTTAYDMALITAEAIQIPMFNEIFSANRYESAPTNKQPKTRYFNSSNSLLNGVLQYDGILMSKTGWTSISQGTLVTAAQRGDTTLIAVVMKAAFSDTKYNDTIALLNYGFDSFRQIELEDSYLKDRIAASGLDVSGFEVQESEPIQVLLPINAELADVVVSTEKDRVNGSEMKIELPICLQLKVNDSQSLELLDSTLNLEKSKITPEQASQTDSPEQSAKAETANIGSENRRNRLAVCIVVVVGIIVFSFAGIKIYVILERNKQRRRRKRGPRRRSGR